MFKQFNNLLALVLVVLIVILWLLQGLKVIQALPEVSGATIATFTLVVQYYFRKAPPTNGGTKPPTGGT